MVEHEAAAVEARQLEQIFHQAEQQLGVHLRGAQRAARFGGVSDTIYASASSEEPGDLPPDVLQNIARIATPFRGFSDARAA